jgi:hypothetical protein|tara:strand:- start:1294 stop:1818 length:525 start_codon:yes stop_codon:yes gene_type:complete
VGVTEINTIFSEVEFSYIKKEFESSKFIENNTWEEGIIHFSKPVEISQIENKDIIKLINNAIKRTGISPLDKNVIKGALFYKWGPGSYIPWHHDSNYSAGLTVYLNDDWNYKNGGLFVYKDDEDIKTIVPQKNKGVLQIGGVAHSTTIISKRSEPRKTLQIFFDKFNDLNNYII